MRILAVIPARGGSKGIPRKNIRLMNGKPLIAYSIHNALSSRHKLDVVVSTDDIEIATISEKYGAFVLMRPPYLAEDNVTLDPVINHAVLQMEKSNNYTYDIVITMQPTSPLLKVKTLDNAIDYFFEKRLDSLISGVNDPHLVWTENNGVISPLYKERLNRQYLPKHLIETGGFLITKREFVTENSRLGKNISIYEVSYEESIDIDTVQDWWIAEKQLSKKKILIRVEGYAEIGLGHIYRSLLLAYNLIDHDIKFVISSKSDLGIEKIKQSFFPYCVIEDDKEIIKIIEEEDIDIVINDILNTSIEYMKLIKKLPVKIVNFEDIGEGAKLADILINDLYEKLDYEPNHYWGSDYYLLRDEFLIADPAPYREEVKEILVLFGGTDPSNLTYKTLQAIKALGNKNIHYTFILGMGYTKDEEFISEVRELDLDITVVKNVKNISEYMQKADLAISSQGRTMLELASMNVPTIVLAQNERELLHTFGELRNGFINLGLGKNIDVVALKETINWLINSPSIRYQMKQYMKEKDLKQGIKRVINLILKD